MTPEIFWAILGIIASTVLPYLLLRRRNNGGLYGSGHSVPELDVDDDFQEEDRPAPYHEFDLPFRTDKQRQLEQDVREILLNGDEPIRKMLSAAWGNELPVFSEEIQDEALIRRIAREVNETTLRVLAAASRSTVQFDIIDLHATDERRAVPYPADETEFGKIGPGSDWSSVVADELALPDDAFAALLVGDELHVIDNIERERNIPRGYLLIDLSGSMREPMSHGTTRVQWAAGVALRLMFRALDGKAQFVVRYFGEEPFDMYIVSDEQGASAVARQLVTLTDRDCGTSIMAALERAYKDITEPSDYDDITTSDVILITDGESALDPARLKEMFGSDSTRLHVALIGRENPVLKEFAVSYSVY